MKTKTLANLLVSVIVGAAITLATRSIQTPMPQLGIDVVYWGIPLSWTMLVIPTHFQSTDWFNLIADLLFWTIFVYLVSATILYIGTSTGHSNPASYDSA